MPEHDFDDDFFESESPPQPRRLGRRLALLGAACTVAGSAFAMLRADRVAARVPDDQSLEDWQAFVTRFVTPDGRVIDTGNGGVTHTEGQGYALLFAEHFDDRATFDSVLNWTQSRMGRTGDALHAWRYQPDAADPSADRNNATDGDMMIAWALLRAGKRWGDSGYTKLGSAIAADLLRWCTRAFAGMTVLLPAASGFDRPGQVVINPSYYVFPAMAALAEAVPDPAWSRLRADGLRLLQAGRFGQWRLPPDWLAIDEGGLDALTPAAGWPARFAWDAVRVPLNMVWAGYADDPALDGVAAFWTSHPAGQAPAWVGLSDDAVAPYRASRGMSSVAMLLAATRARSTEALLLPHVTDADDYYSAALVLLTRVAWREGRFPPHMV